MALVLLTCRSISIAFDASRLGGNELLIMITQVRMPSGKYKAFYPPPSVPYVAHTSSC